VRENNTYEGVKPMNFTNKNILLLIAGIIGLIPVVIYNTRYKTASITPNLISIMFDKPEAKNDYYTGILPNQNNGNKAAYLAWLTQEETALWKDVENLTGISFDECKTLRAEFQQAHDKESADLIKQLSLNKDVSPHIKEIIESVVRDLGCQPLEIISCEYPVAAATHGPVVFVNEEIFNTMSTLAQKFVVGHEIIHILLQDDETRFVFKNKGFFTNEKSLEYAMNKLYRFQELRADMLAALTNADYAQGYNEYVHNALSRRDGEEITELFYPTYALRQTTSEKIQKILVA